MNALLQKLAALLVRPQGGTKPVVATTKPIPAPRKAQEEFYADLFGRTFQEGNQVCFYGDKDEWNRIVQATRAHCPQQPDLALFFRWHRDQTPHECLGYLEAQGKGWKELKNQFTVTIYLNLLYRELTIKLDPSQDS